MQRDSFRFEPGALALTAVTLALFATPAPAQTPTATSAAQTAATDDEAVPAEEQAETLRPWQRQPGPPDGKWLVDKEGREYYIRKFKRPAEGAYLRLEDNRVRLPGGISIEVENEDANFFYARIYRVDNIQPQLRGRKDAPTPDALAAKETEYLVQTQESARIRFVAIGKGLPSSGQWRNGFALADLNKDKKLDLAHGGTRRTFNPWPSLFLGDGKGNLTHWQTATFPDNPYDYGDVAVGDFDGDGNPDLAFAIHLRGLIAVLGDGKGEFRSTKGLDFERGKLDPGNVTRFSSRAIVALDWDGDGNDEILALAEGPMASFAAQKGLTNRVQQSYGLLLYDYDPEAGWHTLPEGKTHPQLFGDSLVAADFNGDGKIDFAAGSNSRGNAALVHLHDAEGTWAYNWVDTLRDRSFARSVGAGDFDGDGRADLLVGYQSAELGVWRTGVDLHLARPEGKWERRTVYVEPGREGFYSLATGDFDRDGNLDFAGGTGDGRIYVFLGDGKGGFSREATEDLAGEATCRVYDLGIGDLDGDGREDLVAAFAGEQCPEGGRLAAWASRKPAG